MTGGGNLYVLHCIEIGDGFLLASSVLSLSLVLNLFAFCLLLAIPMGLPIGPETNIEFAFSFLFPSIVRSLHVLVLLHVALHPVVYRNQAEMTHTCRGTISLHGALIHTVDSCTFVISNGGTQTFHIKAANEVERQSWVTALELAKAKAM